MIERIYCTTNPEYPGIIRLTPTLPVDVSSRTDADGLGFSDPRVVWTLKVRDAVMSVNALKRELAPYRVGGSRDYFRCAPETAREAAVRFTTIRRAGCEEVKRRSTDGFMVATLSMALLLGFALSWRASLDTMGTLGLIALALFGVTAILTLQDSENA